MKKLPFDVNVDVFSFLTKVEIKQSQLISKEHKAFVQRYPSRWPNVVLDEIVASNIDGARSLKVVHQGQDYDLLTYFETPTDWFCLIQNKSLFKVLPNCCFRVMTTIQENSDFDGILDVKF
jgi:hypothetical protein